MSEAGINKSIQNGLSAFRSGNFKDSDKFFHDALSQVREKPVDEAILATVLHVVALFLRTQRRYLEAEIIYKECIQIWERLLFPFHSDIGDLFYELGSLYAEANEFQLAEECLSRSLQILDQPGALSARDASIGPVLARLGTLYMKCDMHDKAEPYYRRAVTISEKSLEEYGHGCIKNSFRLRLASSLFNFGQLRFVQSQWDEAEKLYKRSLELRENNDFVSPPDLADTFLALSKLYEVQSRKIEARAMRSRASAIIDCWFGPERADSDHKLELRAMLCLQIISSGQVSTKIVMQKLFGQGHSDYTSGLHAKAELSYNRCLEMREQSVGPYHADVLKELGFLQRALLAQKKFSAAEANSVRQIQIAEATFGRNHYLVADKLLFLAAAFVVQEEFARAEPLCKRALKIYEGVLNSDSWAFAHYLSRLAELYDAQKMQSESEALYVRSHEILSSPFAAAKRYYPTINILGSGASYLDLADVYMVVGNEKAAEHLLTQLLERRKQALGALNPNVGTVACRLGEFYWTKERLFDGERMYRQGMEIFNSSLGAEHTDVSCCKTSLVYLLRAMKKHNEADELEAKEQAQLKVS